MLSRRKFIKQSGLGFGFAMMPTSFNFFDLNDFVSQRPELSKRKFVSTAVENTIRKVKKSIADPELAWIFENCFPNTLDTTVNHYQKNGKPYTYVITGDIDAMWLRDSSAQVFFVFEFGERR